MEKPLITIVLASWAPIFGILAVFDWYRGRLEGYWTFVICWFAFVSFIDALILLAYSAIIRRQMARAAE